MHVYMLKIKDVYRPRSAKLVTKDDRLWMMHQSIDLTVKVK
jgi:hypothetical protein